MNRILQILRDPIWQVVGVFIAVIAIFLSSSDVTTNKSELSVIPIRQIRMADHWLPNDHFKLLVQGSKKDMENAVLDYYALINESLDPINPTDFVNPIELHPSKHVKRILSVESCSKPFAKACSVDGSSTANGGTFVPIVWTQKHDKWIAEPLLLNKGDQVCVLIASEFADSNLSTIVTPAEWTARISKVQLKIYSTYQDYNEQHNKKSWIDYIWTSVYLEGIGVYWFVILQSIIFITTAALATRSNWLDLHSRNGMVKSALVLFLCTSTSEILVDIFVNRRAMQHLHPVVWPLLALHTYLFMVLIYRALRGNSTPTVV